MFVNIAIVKMSDVITMFGGGRKTQSLAQLHLSCTSILQDLYAIIFILTLEQIIVLNKYCTYNKPISKNNIKLDTN